MSDIEKLVSKRRSVIARIIDESFERAQRQSMLTDMYFPVDTVDLWELMDVVLQRNMAVASVIGFDQEIPYTKGGIWRERVEQLIKLAIGHVMTERDMVQISRLNKLGQRGMIEIINVIFGQMDDLVPRIMGLANLLTWEAIYKGSVSYTDPRTKQKATFNYQTESTLFPSDLAGGNTWDNAGTATGLDDMRALSDAFYALHGYRPTGHTAMSNLQFEQLRAQTATKEAYISMTASAAGTAGAFVPLEAINAMLVERGIPPIYVNENGQPGFDDNVVVETPSKSSTKPPTFTNTRLLPEGYVTFLVKQQGVNSNFLGTNTGMLGQRVFGPTIESKRGSLDAAESAGIFTDVEELSKSPPQIRMYGVGNFLVDIPNPRLLVSQKVA